MSKVRIIIPAQIRAARALLEWSQEKLASEAGVGLTSVREIEGQKRPLDTSASVEICRTLENAGVVFISGSSTEGPGVRLVAGRPHVIKPPLTMTIWDGLPFTVEWNGSPFTIFIDQNALDDLGRFTGDMPNKAYLDIFEKYRGSILDGVVRALSNGRANEKGQLRVTGADIEALV